MGHEYEAQPEEEIQPEISEETSDSEIKQDTEGGARTRKAYKGDGDESLPPKVDSETVTVKLGVSKQVMKEGDGRGPPPRHSICFGTPPCIPNVSVCSLFY